MPIRKLAAPATIAALGLLALASVSAPASTSLRLDPGGGLLTGSTTITNTSSGPAVLATGLGSLTCSNATFTATVTSNSSPTTASGSLNTLTFTSCTDNLPLFAITSCHRHGATLPTISINGSTATATLTDVIIRCNISGDIRACYYTAASATGLVNNLTSTLTFSNVAMVSITAPTTDALPSGTCGGTGPLSVQFRHIVQSGTNRTVTFQP